VAILEIHKYPDPILKKSCPEVAEIDGRVAGFLNSMVDTMYAARGIGLAAPQVGLLERALVMDTDTDNRGKELLKIINPIITESSGEITTEEGCLSVVNYTAEVTRAAKILVKGWTSDHKEIELELEGLQAVCVQHEIDHLDGTLFVDLISKLKRDLYRKRLRKLAKTGGPTSGNDDIPQI
jgi:peptide deformylase